MAVEGTAVNYAKPATTGVVSHDLPSADRVLGASARGLRDSVLPALPAGPAQAMAKIIADVLDTLAQRDAAQADAAERLADTLAELLTGTAGPEPEAIRAEEAIRARGSIDVAAAIRAELDFVTAVTPPAPGAETAADTDQNPVTADTLAAYLKRDKPGADIAVTRIFTPLGGFSKSLVIAELAGADRPADGLVIAIDSTGGPIESGVEDEFPLQQALFAAGIPLPEPLWLEKDASVFGGPFSVVRQVPGRTAATSHGMDPALAPRAAETLARILAGIHAVPVASLPGGDTALQGGAKGQIRRSLDALEEQWLRRRIWPSPTLAAAFIWLADNIPDASPLGLVHGDASPRNLMLADDGQAFIIDWELAHFGDPIEDLVYCRPEMESTGQWAHFLAAYEAHGGEPFDHRRAAYWGLWLDLRNAVLSGAGIHGFETGQQDDIRMVYAGTVYTRIFIQRVGAALLKLGGETSAA